MSKNHSRLKRQDNLDAAVHPHATAAIPTTTLALTAATASDRSPDIQRLYDS
ncbi:MAG: hypothetical protein VB674_01555 [Vicinamibacterales bacterium]